MLDVIQGVAALIFDGAQRRHLTRRSRRLDNDGMVDEAADRREGEGKRANA